LIVHELATNAAKHGALSVPGGRVELSWSGAAASDDTFRLAWREAGGPLVRPPTRRGFGRTLIEGVVAYELSGRARLDFREDGLAYDLEAPLEQVLAVPA
jgi:two-component sensor histidine kinase